MAVRFPEVSQIASIEDECRDYPFCHMTAVATQGSAVGKLSRPRGIAVDPNTGEIYVAEGIPRVTIFSETLEFLRTFTLENMKSSWGIVIHNDSMYMTDTLRHSVVHFKVTGNSIAYINEQGGVGSDIDRYSMPRQLAVSINGYIYVSDCWNNRIKVLDTHLRCFHHISHHSMTKPNDVKLTPDKLYVLCNSESHCIHVFSHSGIKIQSLIPREFGPNFLTTFKSTQFFCLDSRGNFVISDYSLRKIPIFSKEGELIYTLGFQELQLGSNCFYLLSGVAQTANGKLLVAFQMGENLLRMFSL